MDNGYVKITLGGATYRMRPSYHCVREIEARTKLTMQEVLELISVQRLRLEEAVLIVWYGCMASGEEFDSVDALGQVMFEERMTSADLRSSLSQFVLSCLYAPKEAREKWDAEVGQIISPKEDG